MLLDLILEMQSCPRQTSLGRPPPAVCQLDEPSLVHALTHRQLHTMAPGGKVETYEVPLNPTQVSRAGWFTHQIR